MAGALVASLCLSAAAGAAGPAGPGKEPGSRLLERCRAAQLVATEGMANATNEQIQQAATCEAFLDGFIWGSAWDAWREARDMWFCLPEGFSARSGVRAVVSYLEAHPDRLEEDSHLLVFLALTAAYPCK